MRSEVMPKIKPRSPKRALLFLSLYVLRACNGESCNEMCFSQILKGSEKRHGSMWVSGGHSDRQRDL